MSNKYYNYILLDPRKSYKWQYKDNEYHEFNSMKEAYSFLNVKNKGKINSVLKGEKKTFKGYYWKVI